MSDVRFLRSRPSACAPRIPGPRRRHRTALAIPSQPAPLGARGLEVTGGVLSHAAVELRFSPPALTRAQLDGVFGQGGSLPRTGPSAAHVLAYDVRIAGAPARVSVFARFSELPKPESGLKSTLLRVDPASAEGEHGGV